jgi:hypothetical protein
LGRLGSGHGHLSKVHDQVATPEQQDIVHRVRYKMKNNASSTMVQVACIISKILEQLRVSHKTRLSIVSKQKPDFLCKTKYYALHTMQNQTFPIVRMTVKPAIRNCTKNLMQHEILHLKHYGAEGIYQQQIIGIAQSPSQNQTFYNREEERNNRHTILKQH